MVSDHGGVHKSYCLYTCNIAHLKALRLAGPVQSALEDRVAECVAGGSPKLEQEP